MVRVRLGGLVALGIAACSGPAPPWETGRLDVNDDVCDGGLIWETADPSVYEALTCESDQVLVWMSFDPAVRDGASVDVFQDNFRYINLWLFDAGRSDGNSSFYWTNRDPIREVSFDALDGDRLQWTMEVLVDDVTEERSSNAGSCITGDISGLCYFDEQVDQTVELVFDLSVLGNR